MLSKNWFKRAGQHFIVPDSEESKGLKTISFYTDENWEF